MPAKIIEDQRINQVPTIKSLGETHLLANFSLALLGRKPWHKILEMFSKVQYYWFVQNTRNLYSFIGD